MDTRASPPDILIDITRLVWRRLHLRPFTETDRVTLAYVKHYGPRARAVVTLTGVVIVCHDGPSQTLFDWLLDVGSERAARRSLAASLLLGARRPTRPGAWLLDAGPGPGERPRWARTLRRMRIRTLNVVHDLIPFTHPQFCQPWEPAYHQVRLSHTLRTAHAIVCTSRWTLSQLHGYAAARQLPVPVAIHAPLAPELPLARAGARRETRPYFVAIGRFEPRKNHLLLLQVWERLHEHFGDDTPRLVLLGERGAESEQVVRLLERSPALRATVIERSHCTDDETVGWLRHAQALLFPTFAEGCGVSLTDAMSHGVPVIASDLAVFREQAGDIPELLDPLDALGWMETVIDYTDPDCAARRRQIGQLRHYRAPTWVEHFERVDALMQQIDRAGWTTPARSGEPAGPTTTGLWPPTRIDEAPADRPAADRPAAGVAAVGIPMVGVPTAGVAAAGAPAAGVLRAGVAPADGAGAPPPRAVPSGQR